MGNSNLNLEYNDADGIVFDMESHDMLEQDWNDEYSDRGSHTPDDVRLPGDISTGSSNNSSPNESFDSYLRPIDDLPSQRQPGPKLLAHVNLSSSSTIMSKALDYLLIEIRDGSLQTRNHLASSEAPYNRLSVNKLGQFSGDNKVVLVITSRGFLKGELMTAPSWIRLPQATKSQKIYLLRLNSHINSGDSGSWVVDESSGELYGHIVAGDAGTDTAYIISAIDVFEDIGVKCNQSVTFPAKSVLSPKAHIRSELKAEVNDCSEETIKKMKIPTFPPRTKTGFTRADLPEKKERDCLGQNTATSKSQSIKNPELSNAGGRPETSELFAYQSSIALRETINSFGSPSKLVRDVIEELQSLHGVLASLAEKMGAVEMDPVMLEIPLKQCGNVCEEFRHELIKYSSQHGGGLTFQDWHKIRFMNDDIDGFRRLLSGYKSIIQVALINRRLHNLVASETLEGDKKLLKNTMIDFEDHLENINEKVEFIFRKAIVESDSNISELQIIREQQLKNENGFQIYAKFSRFFDQMQISSKHNLTYPTQQDSLPDTVVQYGLQGCKDSLFLMSTKLKNLEQDLVDQFLAASSHNVAKSEELTTLRRLRDERKAARHCMDICSKVDRYLQEDTTTISNSVTANSDHFMTSTNITSMDDEDRELGWERKQGRYMGDAAANIAKGIYAYEKLITEGQVRYE
ncbi:hypothetical protein AWENTII_007214 [Aspergillus wentii]